jgi:hypothetical protein
MVVGLAALLVSAGRGAVVAGGGADCVGAAVCVVFDAQAAINQLVPPNAASRKACRRVSLAVMAILLCRPAPMSRMLLDGALIISIQAEKSLSAWIERDKKRVAC